MAALRRLYERPIDVIAVVRGGGSRTDLVAFDHTDVAHAIAQAPVPVFTGIGHEIDRSVADEVAAVACKTPTAAAAALVARVADAESALAAAGARIVAIAQRRVAMARSAFEDRFARVRRAAQVADTRASSHMATQQQRLSTAAARSLADARHATARHTSRLATLGPAGLSRAGERLDAAGARVRAYDPERVLARGWSLTRDRHGQLVRSIETVSVGDVLTTTLASGTISSTVAGTSTDAGAGDPEQRTSDDPDKEPKR